MITISALLAKTRNRWGDAVKPHYSFPHLYIFVVSNEFSAYSREDRKEELCKIVDVDDEDLGLLESIAFVKIVPLTPLEYESEYKFVTEDSRTDHWVPLFDPAMWNTARARVPELTSPMQSARPRILHFYGYKGGQGRSTVLAMTAKSLADDGYRVLVVDADIEAPSLDNLFSVSTESIDATLMGMSGWAEEIQPVPGVYIGRSQIDLIPCRPRSTEYDMDFAAFSLRTSLDSSTLRLAMNRLKSYLGNEAAGVYDAVLVDHRTGLSSAVIPIMSTLKGSAVIFARPDKMISTGFESHLVDALISFDPTVPGLFVGFSLDPTDKEEKYRSRPEEARFIESMLVSLGAALGKNEPDEPPSDPAFLEKYWVTWFHDSALLTQKLPDVPGLSKENISAIGQIRELTALEGSKRLQRSAVLSRSGATDEGSFVLTADLARLFLPQSPYIYVFGRKGTGKTRLVRELKIGGLGEPMLVASDFSDGGVPANSPAFTRIMQAAGGNYERFWWMLLRCAILNEGELQATVDEQMNILESGALVREFDSSAVLHLMFLRDRRRVFLIDGLETAVPAADLRRFVESAFRFMSTIQYSRALHGMLTLRMFLRSDLAKGAAQNVEQQVEGRSIELRWDRKSILNFALARMSNLPFFAQYFAAAITSINEIKDRLLRGEVPEDVCEQILLYVFPTSLERNKIRTTTFFATYFSDAGGDNASMAGFYPRLFDAFLRKLNDDARPLNEKLSFDGKLLSRFVLTSYDEASAAFIAEVQQEMETLLEFSSDLHENRAIVSKFVESFAGQQTPFKVENLVLELSRKNGIIEERIRKALINMKSLGIFEDRPGYPGFWRAGRVYKAGLNMLYVRTRSSS